MSNKQQTAVEWLMNELTKLGSGAVRTFGELFEQAKELEKEQMFEFWNKGIDCTEEGGKSFEHYYNETYKTGKP